MNTYDKNRTAAAYIRVSTDDQTELSPDSQKAAIRTYAAQHGYTIPDEYIFVDEGISGRSAAKRPAFKRMIAAARQPGHPFVCVLVWKFSRFARNQEESIVYKAMLRKDHVEVISVSEPLVEGPFGGLMERILEWMDEYYSIRLSGEVKRSMTLNAQRGIRQTAPPFGYTLREENGARVMIPQTREAVLVREIFARFIGGEGLYPIARWLNAMGIHTHRGGAFENRTVEYILRNPVYIGKVRWTPTGKTRRNFDNPETIITDGTHEPLIDAATWEQAQRRMKAVREQWGYKARPVYELKDWLSGTVRCAACGATLIFTKPYYFKCNHYIRGRCRFSQHIRADILREALLGRLRDDLDGAETLAYQLSGTSGGTEVEEEIRHLTIALETLERKLTRIRESYAAGIDTIEDYRGYRAGVDAEKKILRERLDALGQREQPDHIFTGLRQHMENPLTLLSDPDGTKDVKNNIVREILASCVFDKNSMTLRIVYRISL